MILELDHEDDDGPMTVGSDDEFDDITCTEQQRDEWGIVDDDYHHAKYRFYCRKNTGVFTSNTPNVKL